MCNLFSVKLLDQPNLSLSTMTSPICHHPLADPVVHNCKNSFCRECIKTIGYKCPVCRSGTVNDFHDVNTRLVLNLLARITVMCSCCGKAAR
jgi:hypothetical protein